MNQLKPCPFCGNTTALAFDWDWYGIVCHACGAFGPNPEKEKANDKSLSEEQCMEHAAELWNKRCPKASDHELACIDSNKSGQPGSVYAADNAVAPSEE